MGINVKLEVHMNSMWHSGNAAAEEAANPVPLTVFQWLHAAFPHTRATRPQTPLQDFPSRTIFCVLRNWNRNVVPCLGSASSPRQAREPILIEMAMGEELVTWGKVFVWTVGLGLNTDGEEEDAGKARARMKLNMTEVCCCQQPCQG